MDGCVLVDGRRAESPRHEQMAKGKVEAGEGSLKGVDLAQMMFILLSGPAN